MKVIGIAGPAGSGKSTVARLLAQRPGFAHLDCDELVREAYRPGGPAHAALAARFGKGIVGPDGAIDRQRLAELVIADPTVKADLEAIVHPMVMETVREAIASHRAGGTDVLLVEGALLATSPHVDRELFDLVVWVEVPERERRRRLARAFPSEVAAQRLALGREVALPTDPRVRIVDGVGSPEEVAARLLTLAKA
ncbi:dephospho-CoA kinase [Candidatus Bipolaricaulota bacterium]|nr:dephospho-CoA kinase [Candidatus Bipolaricaulota bacterium]